MGNGAHRARLPFSPPPLGSQAAHRRHPLALSLCGMSWERAGSVFFPAFPAKGLGCEVCLSNSKLKVLFGSSYALSLHLLFQLVCNLLVMHGIIYWIC